MPLCSIKGCQSNKGQENRSFHTFPAITDKERLEYWLKVVENPQGLKHLDDQPNYCHNAKMVICDLHFEESCFMDPNAPAGKRRLIRNNAIPTLHCEVLDNAEQFLMKIPKYRRSRAATVDADNKSDDLQTSDNEKKNDELQTDNEKKNDEIHTSDIEKKNDEPQLDSENKNDELQLDGEKKNDEMQLDSEKKNDEMQLNSEKKNDEMQLDGEKKNDEMQLNSEKKNDEMQLDGEKKNDEMQLDSEKTNDEMHTTDSEKKNEDDPMCSKVTEEEHNYMRTNPLSLPTDLDSKTVENGESTSPKTSASSKITPKVTADSSLSHAILDAELWKSRYIGAKKLVSSSRRENKSKAKKLLQMKRSVVGLNSTILKLKDELKCAQAEKDCSEKSKCSDEKAVHGNRYESDVKDFCVALYLTSPSAYAICSKRFDLPTKSVVNRSLKQLKAPNEIDDVEIQIEYPLDLIDEILALDNSEKMDTT